MAQGGGTSRPKKVVKTKVSSKRQRQREKTRRPSVKRVNRDGPTKAINKSIEKLTARRASQAGGALELSTLDKTAQVATAEMKKLEEKKQKKSKRRSSATTTKSE